IQIGGAIGLAILATVAATTTAHQAPGTSMPQALTAGYTRGFEVSAIIIALAVPIALTLLRLRPTAEKEHGDDPSLADVPQHGTDAPAGAPSEPPLMAPVTVTSANGRTLHGQARVHVTRQRQATSTNKPADEVRRRSRAGSRGLRSMKARTEERRCASRTR